MSYIKPRCAICNIPIHDELDVTPTTLRAFDRGGVCLACELDAVDATFWQHDGSECVFTANDKGGWSENDLATLSVEVDELFQHQFFERVEAGWSYSFGHPTIKEYQS